MQTQAQIEGQKRRMQNPNILRTIFKKGHKFSDETRKKISIASRKSYETRTPYNLGKPHTIETKEKLKKIWSINKEKRSGKNHFRWIEDRTKLKKQNRRNDPLYFEWRRQVWKRDNYKCRLDCASCDGSIIAHHILPWRDFVDLRYEINNGITLCQVHHPRKRTEEKRLIPVFQGLVSVSND